MSVVCLAGYWMTGACLSGENEDCRIVIDGRKHRFVIFCTKFQNYDRVMNPLAGDTEFVTQWNSDLFHWRKSDNTWIDRSGEHFWTNPCSESGHPAAALTEFCNGGSNPDCNGNRVEIGCKLIAGQDTFCYRLSSATYLHLHTHADHPNPEKVCSCNNGDPVDCTQCANHGQNQCASCDTGYYLSAATCHGG